MDPDTLVILLRGGTILYPRDHGDPVTTLNQMPSDDLDKGPRSTPTGRAWIALLYKSKMHSESERCSRWAKGGPN